MNSTPRNHHKGYSEIDCRNRDPVETDPRNILFDKALTVDIIYHLINQFNLTG